MIIKYWLKIILCDEKKYIRHIYNMMLQDMNIMPAKQNWVALVKQLLGSLGFNEAWLAQSVGNVTLFLNLVNHDQFVQNWSSRLEESSRAGFYSSVSSFQFKKLFKLSNGKKV